jgi:hypothetical protein
MLRLSVLSCPFRATASKLVFALPENRHQAPFSKKKAERKHHKVNRKRHDTLCALSETLASSAFVFHNRFTRRKISSRRVHHIKVQQKQS